MGLSKEYKKLVRTILEEGRVIKGRNGNTLAIPSYSFNIENMANDHLLRLRKMFTKGIQGEFLTLVSSDPLVSVKQFEANGCNYWSEWAGENGELNLDYYNQLHPALSNLIDDINNDPGSRRHVVSLWDNDNARDGSLNLPCCWHNLTFSVLNHTLHLTWTQRSVDTMIGLPSDIFLAYLFLEYVAQRTGLYIGSCMFALSNVHIYEEHIEGAKEILSRTELDYEKPLKFQIKA